MKDKDIIDSLNQFFGITDVSFEKEHEYSLDFINTSQLATLYTKTEYTRIPTKEIVCIKADKYFYFFLLDFINYYKGKYVRYEGSPSPDILREYFKNRYEKWYNEEVLQNKYPELGEIMRDYEVMKKLLVK
jgi:hypothetical protein